MEVPNLAKLSRKDIEIQVMSANIEVLLNHRAGTAAMRITDSLDPISKPVVLIFDSPMAAMRLFNAFLAMGQSAPPPAGGNK